MVLKSSGARAQIGMCIDSQKTQVKGTSEKSYIAGRIFPSYVMLEKAASPLSRFLGRRISVPFRFFTLVKKCTPASFFFAVGAQVCKNVILFGAMHFEGDLLLERGPCVLFENTMLRV